MNVFRHAWWYSQILPLAIIPLIATASGCYEAPPESSYTPKTIAVETYQAARESLAAGETDALALAEAAYQADSIYPEAAWLYASLLGREGRYDDALAVCTRLCEESPNYVQAHLLEGILWDQSGNRESANGAYDRALAVFAHSDASARSRPAFCLYEAVTVFLRSGKLDGVRAINRVLKKFPEYRPAKYVKRCMQDKNRTFLLRWFSERTDEQGRTEESAFTVRNHTKE